ncbi:unnamed protein product [Polarella glacialis]|uniref:Uncharacterized protein n=1 Tax=Polarella glacialis TaxID=89957 RepID=A0A813HFJ7_POLGL|nr:unnamed protein product [Polarella glacialis]CAE8636451.1 unnamed protein product [Polarella glacialis]
MEGKIERMVASRREHFWMIAATPMAVVASIQLAYIIGRHFSIGRGWDDDPMQDRPIVLAVTMVLPIGPFVNVARARFRLWHGHCILIILNVFLLHALTLNGNYCEFLAFRALLVGFRFAMIPLSKPLYMAVFTLMQNAVTMYMFEKGLNAETCYATCESHWMGPELGIDALLVLTCLMVNNALTEDARATLEAKTSRQGQTIAHSLLSVLCDAVLTLGPDLQLLHKSPQLAALLLKAAGPRYLLGEDLMNLVVPEDQAQLRQDLDSHNGCDVRQLRSGMRDSSGGIVQAPFLDFDDRKCHLVGVCEMGLETCATWTGLPSALSDGFNTELPCQFAQSPREEDESSQASWMSGGSNNSEALFDTISELSLTLDIRTFLIERCPPSLARLNGGQSLAGSLVLVWVRSPTDFELRIQHWLQDVDEPQAITAGQCPALRTSLGSQCLRLATGDFVGDCVLEVPVRAMFGGDSEAGSVFLSKLVFSDLQFKYRSSASKSTPQTFGTPRTALPPEQLGGGTKGTLHEAPRSRVQL